MSDENNPFFLMGAMLGEKSGEVTDLRRRIEELSNCVAVLEAKLAQQDDLIKERSDEVKAAVAAALTEAAEAVRSQHGDPDNENGIALAEAAILALIPEDAQAALGRVVADAEARGMEKAADIAKEIADQFVGYMGRIEQAIRSEAAAIRKGGE